MIEHIEERILRTLPQKVLDIIHYQHINPHIVSHELGQIVMLCQGCHILGLELVAGDIQHYKLGEFLLDGYAYRLCDMGLAKT